MTHTLLALALAAQISGFARPDLLVDTDWLAAHLKDANVRVVDMRPRGYAEGHIPGAVWLDNNAIRIPANKPSYLPTPQEFEALMGRLGISSATRVIVYDERGGIYASRLWSILNHFGHDKVALLDGGWVKWEAEKKPVDATVPAYATARFTVKPGTIGIATAEDVKAAIGTALKLLDARTQAEIDGKDLRNIKRGGFIEGSIPAYWEDTLTKPALTFKSPAEIEGFWKGKGVTRDASVITYCQVGMRASHDLFTLALLGHDLTKMKVYLGSWEDWGNRDDTPIKTKQ
jgi:thiosulfate/3-mercaptopyruvate sulfurtransferase